MRTCTTCGEQKPLSEFAKDSYKADGVRPYCKSCGVEYTMRWEAEHRDQRNAYRRANHQPSDVCDVRRGYWLKREYGLTPEDYTAMLEEQEHRCAICGKERSDERSRRLVVDHCHDTDMVRGLLCDMCNLALGLFRDRPELMQRAAAYVGG
jgi:hypothetical protein